MAAFDKEEFLTFINQKWLGGKTCPCCGINSWNVGDLVAPSLYTEGGGITIGGPMMPFVPLICLSCGYTLFFNPAATGILKD